MKNTKLKKILISVLVSILIFLAGMAVGLYQGYYRTVKPLVEVESLLALAHSGEFIHYQYLHSDYPAAKEALLSHLKVIEKMQSIEDSVSITDDKTIYMEKAMTLARLGLLEANEGNNEASEMYLDDAVLACRQTEVKFCTSQELQQLVEIIDKKAKERLGIQEQ